MDLTGVLTGTENAASPQRSASRAAGHRRLDVLLTLLVVGVAASWALLTPPLRAPDEPQHLSSVLRIAYGGGWPRPGDAVLAPVLQAGRAEVALTAELPGRYLIRSTRPLFSEAHIVPAPDRSRVTARDAVASGPAARPDDVDQMTQHPPLYYAVGAGFLRVTGMLDNRWDQQLLALRILDVLLLAPLVPLASWSARRLTGSTAAGAVAAAFPLFVPQVGHILGAVNNDALVTLVGGVVTALAVRVLTGDRSLRTALLIGGVVGVGLLTKIMAVFLLPMVVLAYLLGRRTPPLNPPLAGPAAAARSRLRRGLAWLGRRSGWWQVVVAGVVALALGGWWWVRNAVVYGAVQPVGLERDLGDHPARAWYHYLLQALVRLARSFFGEFGWLDLRTPVWFWLTATVVLVALCGGALCTRATWRPVAALLALPGALVVAVVYNGWGYYQQHGLLVGHQGRYLFAGVLALAVVVAVAAVRLVGESEVRLRILVPVVVLVGTGVAAFGLRFAFDGFYRAPGWTLGQAWARWELLSPLAPGWLVAVPAVTGVLALATVVVAALAARPQRTPAL